MAVGRIKQPRLRPVPSNQQLQLSWASVALLVALAFVFFTVGLLVGSQLVDPAVAGKDSVSQASVPDLSSPVAGLPGTSNILKKWSDKTQSAKSSFDRIRGSFALRSSKAKTMADSFHDSLVESRDSSKHKEADSHKSVPFSLFKSTSKEPVLDSSSQARHRSSTSSATIWRDIYVNNLQTILRNSLHATGRSFVQTTSNVGNKNIFVAAWIYLDPDADDADMRTVFSNKAPGCEGTAEQYGVSMYVNAWQTKDHKLYVEYGGSSSGCHKISCDSCELSTDRWYHVALYAGQLQSILYLDGQEISSLDHLTSEEAHSPQHNILTVGQYGKGIYPLFGNISHLVVMYDLEPDIAREALSTIVKTTMDISKTLDWSKSLSQLVAVFPFTDAIEEIPDSSAINIISVISNLRGSESMIGGKYTFPVGGSMIAGVSIALIDGVNGREVTDEMRQRSDEQGRKRREAIKAGMKHAWDSYRKYAWGKDELKPLSNRGVDVWGGMGVTLVDSLDTLWVMGMKQEFEEAKRWVDSSLSFNRAGAVSVFETTIRELGGLIAAHSLSGDDVFLQKAKTLADKLLPAFLTKSGIPTGMVNFKSGTAASGWAGSSAILSELGSVQVEFRYLAHHTGEKKYETMAMKAFQVMRKKDPQYGLFPIKVSIADGSFADTQITFGALGDSFYEYLLKVWLQGGKKENWLRKMYDKAMDGVMEKLLMASDPSGLAFLSDWNGRRNARKMDHLVCFMPGLLALGAVTDPKGRDSPRAKRDMAVAKALMYTCREMYHRTASGISPEYVEFPVGSDMRAGPGVAFYILRPETAESLFILNQLTGDPIYRDWAWEIWEAIDRHCKTKSAYGSLQNVNSAHSGVDDRMESFFLAETIKYLYLVQDPDNEMDLSKYVFNTEAHPTKILDDTHIPIEP